MKNIMNMNNVKKAAAGVLAATLVVSSFASSKVFANEIRLINADYEIAEDYEAFDYRMQYDEKFISVKGKVVGIEEIAYYGSAIFTDEEGNEVENPDAKRVRVTLEKEDGGIVNLTLSSETLFIKGEEISEGDIVTGFYDSSMPAMMIYPPIYNASAIAVDIEDYETAFLGRFDENLVSADNTLKLNISDSTEIVYEDGTPFRDGESVEQKIAALADMKLAVLYTASTRSIPAQTTPQKIIVPYSNLIQPLADMLDVLDDELFTDESILLDIENYPIIVEDEIIDGNAYLNGSTIMLPLRAISEALGFDVEWDAIEKSVLIDGYAEVKIGEDTYDLGVAPEITDDKTYVPMSFFSDVLFVNNAYMFEGEIVINQQEQMY